MAVYFELRRSGEALARRARDGRTTQIAVSGALVLIAAMGAPSARAEVLSTAQARIANAEFLVTAVPPARSAAVCQIDSGVNVSPDTSQVVGRLAIGNGDVGDGSPSLHGTLTAMVMGAGVNAFGMVGLWPAIRIVSVRANTAGQGTFTAAAYINAIDRCNSVVGVYDLKVIELALASEGTMTPDEAAGLAAVVQGARASGMSVVAGAGNNSGGPVLVPASTAGVLAVGGSDGDGERCASSAAGAALQAPGCGLDAADPASGEPMNGVSGTSGASAIVAAVLAAIRSWRPDLDPAAAEQVLTQTARNAPGGPLLDAAAAFRQLDLGIVVDANQPPAQATPVVSTPADAGSADVTTRAKRLARPLVRVRRTRGNRGVLVTVRNRPKGVQTVVSVYRRAGRALRFVRSATRRSSKVTIRTRSWQQLRVRFRDPSARLAPSRATIVNRSRAASVGRG